MSAQADTVKLGPAAKMAIEIEKPGIGRQRQCRPERRKAGIAIGLHQIQPVHRAAQHDGDETVVTRHRREGDRREDGSGSETAG